MSDDKSTSARAPGAAGAMGGDLARKFAGPVGIRELMDDLGQALTTRSDMLMLGGGNPAPVPAVQALWRQRMRELLDAGEPFDRMLNNYDPPQGNPPFLKAFAGLLSRAFGWDVRVENLAVTAGTQTAAFFLLNLLAGPGRDGRKRKILLPLAPEYIGYADQSLEAEAFVACRPAVTWPEGEAARVFKYRIDFGAVESALARHDVAAIVVSRPTNPSGNVLDQDELERLARLAQRHGAYLIVDNAYGCPAPGVIFRNASPIWRPHVINLFSLSKLGLPGTRTGIVLGPAEIVSAVQTMTAVVGLANGNVGQQLALPLVQSGRLLELGPEILRPFYLERSLLAQQCLRRRLEGSGADWAIHANEGAFFLWLWVRDLAGTSMNLYHRLKARNVLVVPGEYFFFGLEEGDWPHRRQCIRINYAQPVHVVDQAFEILARTLREG